MVTSSRNDRNVTRLGPSDDLPFSHFLVRAVNVFSIVLLIAGLLLLAVSLWRMGREGGATLDYRMLGVILSLVLLALAAITFSLLRVLRFFSEAEKTRQNVSHLLTQRLRAEAPRTEPRGPDFDRLETQIEQALKLLADINENTLLDEAGRRQKCEFLAHQERNRIFRDIDRLVQEREWARAKTLLEGMRQRYPGNPEVDGYARQVEDLRKQAFAEELNQTQKTIADLVAISAWDRAIRQAEVLMEKHPDMPAAKELQLQLRAERAKFREEQIRRMSADIQRSIAKKRWNDALHVAQQLTDKYPDSIEAETLLGQMKTLQTNAEIEKRQELEEQIKDLIKRRNFIQAVELARYVIEQYPTSPQASALRKQIEKLDELARQQEKELQL